MGRQIRYAHSGEDETALMRRVNERFELLSVPRFFRERVPPLERPGLLSDSIQFIVMAASASEVLTRVTTVRSDESTLQVYPYEGLALEWVVFC